MDEDMEDLALKYRQWQIPLEEALEESDLDRLSARVQTVEILIFERLKQLASSTDSTAERGAINDALNILRALKSERLAFPDWK